MRARRLQLYWFPLASTLAVAAAPLLLDLPPSGALVRHGEHGFQFFRYDTSSFLTWSIAVLAFFWVGQALTDRRGRPSPLSHSAYYGAFGILLADVLFLAGAHGRTSTEAGAPLWAFLGLVPAAFLGNHVAAKLEDARARSEEWDAGPARRPSLRLRRSETALWTGRGLAAGYPGFHLLMTPAYVVVVATIAEGGGGFHVVDVPFIALWTGLFVYGIATGEVRVTVGESGVRVEVGPLRFPLWTIPLDDLIEARVEDVRPLLRYGGYGYRAKGGRRCMVVRAGDGVLLRRRAGRDVLVTVDRAREGAALLNGLIRRRSPFTRELTSET